MRQRLWISASAPITICISPSRVIRSSSRDRAPALASHARETCDLIIPEDLTDTILAVLEERGLFEPDIHGLAEVSAVEKAVTYRQ